MNVPNLSQVEAFRLLCDDAIGALDALGAFLAPYGVPETTKDFIKALENGKFCPEYTVALTVVLLATLESYRERIKR